MWLVMKIRKHYVYLSEKPYKNIMTCPCGKIYLPKGYKYSKTGLYLELISGSSSYKFDLVHNKDVELSSGRSFITSTPIIKSNITSIDSIVIKVKMHLF